MTDWCLTSQIWMTKIKIVYLTLCKFPFEIQGASLIQHVVSPHCGDNIMAQRFTTIFVTGLLVHDILVLECVFIHIYLFGHLPD